MAAPILVEIGNGEGSFVGLKVVPGNKYKLVIHTSVCLANVALDPSVVKEFSVEKCDEELDEMSDEECYRFENGRLMMILDGTECPQIWNRKERLQSHCPVYLREGSEISFYVKGNATYYICGYKTSVDYGVE